MKRKTLRRALLALGLFCASLLALAWFLGDQIAASRVVTDGESVVDDAAWRAARRFTWKERGALGEDASFDDRAPTFDGRSRNVLFARRTEDGPFDLFVCRWTPGGPTPPTPLLSLNSPFDDVDPVVIEGGRALLFASNREGGQGGYDLYRSDRTRDGFTAPVNLGPRLNSPKDDRSPTLSGDERHLVLASNRLAEDGLRMDLFEATRESGGFSTPVLLTALATRDEGESRSPSLSPDGRFLLFASDRRGGVGGFDLYQSLRFNGEWREPMALASLNTEADELDPAFSVGGNTLLFVRTRSGGDGLATAITFADLRELVVLREDRGLLRYLLLALAALLAAALLSYLYLKWHELHPFLKFLILSLVVHLLVLLYVHTRKPPEPPTGLGGERAFTVSYITSDDSGEASEGASARGDRINAPAPSETAVDAQSTPSDPTAPAARDSAPASTAPARDAVAMRESAPDQQSGATPVPSGVARPRPSSPRAQSPESLKRGEEAASTGVARATPVAGVATMTASVVSATPAQSAATPAGALSSPSASGSVARRATDAVGEVAGKEPAPQRASGSRAASPVAAGSAGVPRKTAEDVASSGGSGSFATGSNAARVGTAVAASGPSSTSEAAAPGAESPRAASQSGLRSRAASRTREGAADVATASPSRSSGSPSAAPVRAASGALPGSRNATDPVAREAGEGGASAPARREATLVSAPALARGVAGPASSAAAPPSASSLRSRRSASLSEDARGAFRATRSSVSRGPTPLLAARAGTKSRRGSSQGEAARTTAARDVTGERLAADFTPSNGPRPSSAPTKSLGNPPTSLDGARPDRLSRQDLTAPVARSTVAALAPGVAPRPHDFLRRRTVALPQAEPALPSVYAQRTGAARMKALVEAGGDDETEAAVLSGLRHLASRQRRDGSIGRPDRDEKYGDVEIGKTALALLAFLGSGFTADLPGEFQETVQRAIAFLRQRQDRRNGHFGDCSSYGHAIATYAFAEAYAMTRDASLRLPLRKAVSRILEAQYDRPGDRLDGGFGYYYRDEGRRFDRWPRLSVTVWQIMALESARLGGLEVEDSVLARTRDFVLNTYDARRRALRYNHDPGWLRNRYQILPGSVSAGLFALQLLGADQQSDAVRAADRFIAQRPPRGPWRKASSDDFVREGVGNEYYLYYATLARRLQGGDPWAQWNERLKPLLLRSQSKDGSWKPISYYAEYAKDTNRDRVYTTAMCVLMLEIYYRYDTPLLKKLAQEIAAAPQQPRHRVVVDEVEDGTRADRAGFRPGDVIVSIGGHVIEDLDDVRAVINGLGNRTRIVIRRRGRERALNLRGRLSGLTLTEQ